jgi:hypothetical protein
MKTSLHCGTLAAAALATALFGCSHALIPADWPSWERLTAAPAEGLVPGHEERFRIAFINAQGEMVKPVVANGAVSWKYPDGSIILKAGYWGSAPPGKGETPSKLSVMMKSPGDPRARGGWLWVVRDTASGVETVIDAPYCVDCHSYANGPNPYGDKNTSGDFRDYVYLPYTTRTRGG